MVHIVTFHRNYTKHEVSGAKFMFIVITFYKQIIFTPRVHIPTENTINVAYKIENSSVFLEIIVKNDRNQRPA